MITYQVCDRNQVGEDYDNRSQSEECVPYHMIRDQQGDRDQEAIEIGIGDQARDLDQASVGYFTRSTT